MSQTLRLGVAVIVNGVGIVLELSYVVIYLCYASAKGKAKVTMIAIPVLLLFSITAIVSAFAFHDNAHRKQLVGSIGLIVSITMYGSPLVVMKKVIQTKSVEFMPLPLSLCTFLATTLWLTYGALIRDIFVAGPSVVGIPLGILQLVLHCKYRNMSALKEPNKGDLEKGNLEKVELEKVNMEMEDMEKNVAIHKNSNF
ncbi:unnamed protein product [Lupinus luteus]|uniref:Bidirectional sugar transporter SWEET n=1 Tax=Lupinus luteus TaxID=3873 RepID=A0AAV1Y2W1_LUPLU